ncbi:TIGR04282 family arsenosugar biosynthesis glycosyltransferase [Pseudonocardia sp. DLS-67]
MSRPVLLLVLAKAPHAGRVKTRLCPPADPLLAARIAAAALLDTLAAVQGVPDGRPVLALSGDLAGAERADEILDAARGIPVIAQRGLSLGERIAAAHADAAAFAPGSPALQIGMDTPQITAELLHRCHQTLTAPGTDAVLGPADDGGWWALGLRDPRTACCIRAVPTSRADTGTRTARALRAHGLRVAELPGLSDVDTAADAYRVAAQAGGTRFAAAVAELSWAR